MKFEIQISLSQEQLALESRKINLHYLGDETCNILVGGEIKAKYPNKETKAYKDAIFSLHSYHRRVIKVEFDEATGRPKYWNL